MFVEQQKVLQYIINLEVGSNICSKYITFSPTVPPSAARISQIVAVVEAPGGESGKSKCGGKQWQTTPKNLPRMQRTRAIPVAELSSGFCPNRLKG